MAARLTSISNRWDLMVASWRKIHAWLSTVTQPKRPTFAWVPVATGEPRVRHREGLPSDPRQHDLPNAALLVIEEAPDGVFLFRFSRNGADAGDTWHQSADDAKRQGLLEYGPLNWQWAPPEEQEVPALVRSLLEKGGKLEK